MSKPRHYKKVYQKEGAKKKWAVNLLQASLLGFLVMPVGAFAIFIYYAKDLPRPEKLTEITLAQPTKIYDRTGNVLLYEVHGEEKREVIPLANIPPHFQQAVLATEDAGFYEHQGVSLTGTGRALLINLGLRSSQFRRPGGSTITQQLARNSFLTKEKTIPRKIREFILTVELERRYSKNEILGFYLNQIPFGANAYGIGAASELYFQKQPKDLTLAESAALAAMIQAPTYYSPYGPNREGLLERKDYVLSRMNQEDFITPEEMESARNEQLTFQDVASTIRAPHFVLSVLDSLVREYGEDFIRERGLRVQTSLDWELQQQAERIVKETGQRNAAFRAHNEALVALNPQTGEILALVGSKDWFAASYPENCVSGKDCLFDPKVNVAMSYPGRQPGSAFKPIVYATAFEKGVSDETSVIDEETNFGVWGGKEYIPQNYDGKFRGEVTLREALAQSLNIPSVKVLVDMAGIADSIETAQTLGITTLNRPLSAYGPSLVLGGGEVRLLDIVSAYGVFAMEGQRVPPTSILRVESSSGEVIFSNSRTPATVFSPHIAQVITNILSDNEARTPLFGANSALYFPGYDVAAKTGTTQDYRDAWTIGYIPVSNRQGLTPLAVGVWTGNNNNVEMRGAGVLLSAPIWNQFMRFAISTWKSTP